MSTRARRVIGATGCALLLSSAVTTTAGAQGTAAPTPVTATEGTEPEVMVDDGFLQRFQRWLAEVLERRSAPETDPAGPASTTSSTTTTTTVVPWEPAPHPDASDVDRVRLTVGVTHTQHSADEWNDAGAVARAEALLAARPLLQNQHLMGWGALSPEPAPGRYDWASLDQRIELVRRTGGTPVLTLCCAPDWMKGGPPGATDWSRLEEAPHPDHFADFADLAARAAARYPDIRYFQVWNELKGFHDPVRNTWDIESYTRLYNLVHDAVTAVRPDARIGGPYVVLDSWADRSTMGHPSEVTGPWGTVDQRALDAITYWLDHNAGADFLAVDIATFTRDAGHVGDPFAGNAKITAVMDWIDRRTDLPVWVSELYTEPGGESGDQVDPHREAALLTSALATMAEAGVAVAFQWGPQADGATCTGGCLWTDTRSPGGGRPTPTHAALTALAALPPGTPIAPERIAAPGITELSSADHTLLVNEQPAVTTIVTLDGEAVTLAPYEVRLIARR